MVSEQAPFLSLTTLLTATFSGAFFGTTFPTLFFQTYTEFLAVPFKWSFKPTTPSSNPSDDRYADINPPADFDSSRGDMPVNPNPYGGTRPPMGKIYEPRIYGFKVSERARSGPRMGWLRDRPDSHSELDELDWKGRWKADLVKAKLAAAEIAAAGEASTSASAARPKVGKGKLFEDEELKENDEEDVSEEEEAVAGVAT
jgi:casein kinase II subunit beta